MTGISLLMFKNAETVKTKAMTKDEEESDASSEIQEYRQLLLKYLATEGEKTL